jgi:hypothetical protein
MLPKIRATGCVSRRHGSPYRRQHNSQQAKQISESRALCCLRSVYGSVLPRIVAFPLMPHSWRLRYRAAPVGGGELSGGLSHERSPSQQNLARSFLTSLWLNDCWRKNLRKLPLARSSHAGSYGRKCLGLCWEQSLGSHARVGCRVSNQSSAIEQPHGRVTKQTYVRQGTEAHDMI